MYNKIYSDIINVFCIITAPLSRRSVSVIVLQENKNTSAVNELVNDAKYSSS